MSSSRRGVALLSAGLAAMLAVSACTTPSSAASSAITAAASSAPSATGPLIPTASTLHWHACTGEVSQLGVRDCTMLSVPK